MSIIAPVNALHETCMKSSMCCSGPVLAWVVSVVPVVDVGSADSNNDARHIKASLSLCCWGCKKRLMKLRRYAAQVERDSQTLLWQMSVTEKNPIYFKQDVHVTEPKAANIPAYNALFVGSGMIQFECGQHTLLINAIGTTSANFNQNVFHAISAKSTDVVLQTIGLVASKFTEQVLDVLDIMPTVKVPWQCELCTVSQMHKELETLQTHCLALAELKLSQTECDQRRISSLLVHDTRPFRAAEVFVSDINHNVCCMELYGLAGEVRRLESMAVTVPGAEEAFAALREQYCRLQSIVRCSGEGVDRRAYCIGIRAIEDHMSRTFSCSDLYEDYRHISHRLQLQQILNRCEHGPIELSQHVYEDVGGVLDTLQERRRDFKIISDEEPLVHRHKVAMCVRGVLGSGHSQNMGFVIPRLHSGLIPSTQATSAATINSKIHVDLTNDVISPAIHAQIYSALHARLKRSRNSKSRFSKLYTIFATDAHGVLDNLLETKTVTTSQSVEPDDAGSATMHTMLLGGGTGYQT